MCSIGDYHLAKVVFAVVFLFLLFSGKAVACSCSSISDEQEFLAAKSVLLVRVTKTEFVETSEGGGTAVHGVFKVIQTFKGSRGPLEYLVSDRDSCWRPLIAGELYIIFSHGMEFEAVNICTNNRAVLDEEDAQFLAEFAADD